MKRTSPPVTGLCDCGHAPSPHDSFTEGYGISRNGKTACYSCCAEKDRSDMDKTGRAILYLGQPKDAPAYIGNWPGSLRYSAIVHAGRHNIAGVRYDAWFTDHAGRRWHGVTYGDMTQICHCRRLA